MLTLETLDVIYELIVILPELTLPKVGTYKSTIRDKLLEVVRFGTANKKCFSPLVPKRINGVKATGFEILIGI